MTESATEDPQAADPVAARAAARDESESDSYCIVMTTVASQADARTLARALLAGKLAACIQLIPVESLYTWNEAVNEESEVLLLVKARPADYYALEAAIRAVHSYEVPEILMVPVVRGFRLYLDWVDSVTRRT